MNMKRMVQVQQTDLAGNVSSAGSVSGAITVDIAVPSQTVTTWAMSADTGFSATDEKRHRESLLDI